MIRGYFNLDVSSNLNHYSGPILFIRRLRDEIINTNELEPFRTNRVNDLLVKLMINRLPKLMADTTVKQSLMQWLWAEPVTRIQIENRLKMSDEEFLALLPSNQTLSYPLAIGEDPQMSAETKIKLVVYLVSVSSGTEDLCCR